MDPSQNNENMHANMPPHDPNMAYQYQQLQLQQQHEAAAQQMHMMHPGGFFAPPSSQMPPHLHQQLMARFQSQFMEIDNTKSFKNHELPLARIKKIMKSDEDVRIRTMISAEAPIIFAKACEMFIVELTVRSWVHTEEAKRRTLQRNDIAAAISKTDIFDFLIDIVPREDGKPNKKAEMNPGAAMSPELLNQQQYLMMVQQQAQQMAEQHGQDGTQDEQEDAQNNQDQSENSNNQELIDNTSEEDQNQTYTMDASQVLPPSGITVQDPNFIAQQHFQNYFLQMQQFQNMSPQMQQMYLQSQHGPMVDGNGVAVDPQTMEQYQFDPNTYQAYAQYGHPEAQQYAYEGYDDQQQAYEQDGENEMDEHAQEQQY